MPTNVRPPGNRTARAGGFATIAFAGFGLIALAPFSPAIAAAPIQSVEYYLTHQIERTAASNRCKLLLPGVAEKDADCVNVRKAVSLMLRPSRPR